MRVGPDDLDGLLVRVGPDDRDGLLGRVGSGVWRFTTGDDTVATLMVIAAYTGLGVASVGVARGTAWYDRVCGTRVVASSQARMR